VSGAHAPIRARVARRQRSPEKASSRTGTSDTDSMTHPGGIITVSFGKFASYVGAHYWNFQVRHRRLQKFGRAARLHEQCSMPKPN
jgi:Misato Segment II tubulin-like domain